MTSMKGMCLMMGVLMVAGGAGWGEVEVLKNFEDSSPLDYYDPSDVVRSTSTDTPGPLSVYSTTFQPKPNPEYEGCYVGLEFNPVKDFTGKQYVNFYLKASGVQPGCRMWVQGLSSNWGAGMGWDLPETLPTEWTYYSFALADSVSQWSELTHDWTGVFRLEFAFGGEGDPPAVGGTVYIDHITLTTTSEEGMIPTGPPPADCEDPYLTQSTAFPVSGSAFSISVKGIEPACVESVVWTKDGQNIERDACSTLAPAGAGIGDTVTVESYDGYGNKFNFAQDMEFAEVGFKKVASRVVRFDHITMSDTPEAGMLGASGNVYVLSECEDGDIPGSVTEGTASVNTTDSAGAGSSACLEIDANQYIWVWFEHYGANVDISCCPNYLNFYVKVVDADLPVWGSVGMGTDDDWNTGMWGDAAFTFPAAGSWQYVSIDLSTLDQWGPPNLATVAAVGFEFDPTLYYSVNTVNNPEVFESGAAVFQLTSDMVNSDIAWTWVDPSWADGTYVEAPTADFLANGGTCGGAKALTGITDAGLTLVFDPVREGDEGEYCATLTIDGVPTEICATLADVLPEGASVPVAGVAAIGILVLACGLGGFAGMRRKK